MNTTIASCGHHVPAVGAPGSSARRAAEKRTCGLPRCRSGLPKKFTDDECEAFCALDDRNVSFSLDLMTKAVLVLRGRAFDNYPSLTAAVAALT